MFINRGGGITISIVSIAEHMLAKNPMKGYVKIDCPSTVFFGVNLHNNYKPEHVGFLRSALLTSLADKKPIILIGYYKVKTANKRAQVPHSFFKDPYGGSNKKRKQYIAATKGYKIVTEVAQEIHDGFYINNVAPLYTYRKDALIANGSGGEIDIL